MRNLRKRLAEELSSRFLLGVDLLKSLMGKIVWVFLNDLHVGRAIARSSSKIFSRPSLVPTEVLDGRTAVFEKIGSVMKAVEEAQVPALMCLAMQSLLVAKVSTRIAVELEMLDPCATA